MWFQKPFSMPLLTHFLPCKSALAAVIIYPVQGSDDQFDAREQKNNILSRMHTAADVQTINPGWLLAQPVQRSHMDGSSGPPSVVASGFFFVIFSSAF